MFDWLRNVNELVWVGVVFGSLLLAELERCRAVLEDIRDRLPKPTREVDNPWESAVDDH